jgi:MATE family multidrug resistance protein
MPESLQDVRVGLRSELAPMFRLAWPVATAELGWMAMGLVDLMMVGRVSAEAIGAVSIGGNLFFAVAIFGMGMLLGLDYVISHALGARRVDDARAALVHGMYLGGLLALALSALLFALPSRLQSFGIQPGVAREAGPYLRALTCSMLPLLLYTAVRRYLQALGLVRAVMVALVSANVVNALVNWLLVFGNLGFPRLGAEGSGWATCASRVYLLFFLLAYAAWYEHRHGAGLALPWRFDPQRFRQLVRLGLPAAVQTVLEVGVFATVTVLAGSLAADQLAAHQIALSAAAFSWMVPLGISSAAAVRVGRAVGRRDAAAAVRAGWTALLLGAAFMTCSAIAFLVVPRTIIGVFTSEPTVLQAGVALLAVAAVFQLFDGVQVVATGALRGAADTRTPMFASLIGYWVIGLPLGYLLCFELGSGVVGLWIGLSVALISVAAALTAVWSLRCRELVRDCAARHAASAAPPAIGSAMVKQAPPPAASPTSMRPP